MRFVEQAQSVMKTDLGKANAIWDIYNRSQIGWTPYRGRVYDPKPTTDQTLSLTTNELMFASDVFAANRFYCQAIGSARAAGNEEGVDELKREAVTFFENKENYFRAANYAHALGEKEEAARLNLLALEAWAKKGIRKFGIDDYTDLDNLLANIYGESHGVRYIPDQMLAERRADLYNLLVDSLTAQGELKAAAEISKKYLGDHTRARALYRQFRETSTETQRMLSEAQEEALFAESLEDHKSVVELYETVGAYGEAEQFIEGALYKAEKETPLQDYAIRKLCELTTNPIVIAHKAVNYGRRDILEEMVAEVTKEDESYYNTGCLARASDIIGERYPDLAHQLASRTIDICIARNNDFSAAVVGMKEAYRTARAHCPERIEEVQRMTRTYAEKTGSWFYLNGKPHQGGYYDISAVDLLTTSEEEKKIFDSLTKIQLPGMGTSGVG